MTMTKPQSRLLDNSVAGYWRILVYPYGSRESSALDVTFVRSAPTIVESLATADPFGPTTASITFPAITILDRLGSVIFPGVRLKQILISAGMDHIPLIQFIGGKAIWLPLISPRLKVNRQSL